MTSPTHREKKEGKPKITFTELVRVYIKDESKELKIIKPFLDWALKNNVYPENVGEARKVKNYFKKLT